jgi:signal transduction histidine kinase
VEGLLVQIHKVGTRETTRRLLGCIIEPVPFPSLAALIPHVAHAAPQQALDAVVQASLALTGSRHALVAVVNPELGVLEVRAVAGAAEDHTGERMPLDVGVAHGIVGFVAATGEPFVTGNVHEEPRYRQMFESTRSELAVPILDRNRRALAVLNLESDRRNGYGEPEQQAASALAGLASMVLEREGQGKREEALIQIGLALDSTQSEEALIGRVILVAEQILRLQACSIFLFDPRQDLFVLRGTVGSLREDVGRIGYRRGEGFTGWVCETGQPIMLDDPQTDPRWRGKFVEFPSEQIASFVAMPIVIRGECVGAIRVLRKKSDNRYLDNRFSSEDRLLLRAIADQVAAGLENIRSLEARLRDERMIAWGELSAKSSHMIGNRVFALKGDLNELSYLLQDSPPDADAIRDLHGSLSTNLTRIEETLQDFRDFVTATQLNRKPVDLAELLRETIAEVAPRRSSVVVESCIEEGLPAANVDPSRIRRAVSELLENALIHTLEGAVTVRLRGAGSVVAIDVEDTGPGVPQPLKDQIFRPFFSTRVKGMGLGLSIVKGIVDAHGGQVVERGEEGAGARFTMLLPLGDDRL